MSYIDRQIDAHKQGATIGKQLVYESLGKRIGAYFIVFFIPSLIVWLIILNGNFKTPDSLVLENLMILVPPLVLPLFKEWRVRVWRRREGYDMNSNITELVAHNALKEEAKKQYSAESEARSEMGVGGDDKTDIRYWKGLLDDGIIDEAEYGRVKSEILARVKN